MFGAILFPERRYMSWSRRTAGHRDFKFARDWRATAADVRAADAAFDSADGGRAVEGPVQVGEAGAGAAATRRSHSACRS